MRVGLLLEPLDTLFFRGGRPFGAGLPGESALPSPQTLAGALRTFLLEREGADLQALRGHRSLAEGFRAAGAAWLAEARFRGPWLAECSPDEVRPLLARPASVRVEHGEVRVMRPASLSLPGWRPPEDGILPLWPPLKRPKDSPDLIRLDGLRAWLAGEAPAPEHFVHSRNCYELEERTGIRIDPATWVAAESEIYTTRHLRLKPGFAFYAEAELPEEKVAHFVSPVTVAWGGEGRRALARRVNPVKWPKGEAGERTALLLLAPAFFEHGWRPDYLGSARLRAAAVEGPYVASGWDLARGGPKPARFGVAAGSVYFLEGEPPAGDNLSSNREDAALGYGFFLRGTWSYAGE